MYKNLYPIQKYPIQLHISILYIQYTQMNNYCCHTTYYYLFEPRIKSTALQQNCNSIAIALTFYLRETTTTTQLQLPEKSESFFDFFDKQLPPLD